MIYSNEHLNKGRFCINFNLKTYLKPTTALDYTKIIFFLKSML